MRKKIISLLSILGIASVMSLGHILISPHSADAAISQWQKSVSFTSDHSTQFSSQGFRDAVLQAQNANADMITLVIPYAQSNIYSTDVHRPWNAPTDEVLIDAIQFIHSQGLAVTLAVHASSNDGSWRAHIDPADREAWFNAYGSLLLHDAQIAQSEGVEQMMIGVELISMASDNEHPTNTENWRQLISDIRSVYSGLVTYSANWGSSGFVNEKDHIEFWPSLDSIGISAYFNLTKDESRPIESLKESWSGWDWGDIRELHNEYGKPVIFTEVGYRSIEGGHREPWNYSVSAPVSQQAQADAYEALFEYWNDQSYMQGVHWWEWQADPNAGGSGNAFYTPQNKLAEEVMREWFGMTNGGTDPEPEPPGEIPTFSVAVSGPSSLQVNEQGSFTTQVTAQNEDFNGGVVNVEIYQQGGGQVFQQFFEDQDIAASSSQSYPVSWTPSSTGTYVVKAGIFSSGWSSLHQWEDNLMEVNVGENGTEPPLAPEEIDIWWPKDGVTVSGVQPIKGILRSDPVEEYEMFWRVGDGSLVQMFNMYDDGYPHKKQYIDFSGWTWEGSGPYVITLVAQKDGSTVAENSTNIFVAN